MTSARSPRQRREPEAEARSILIAEDSPTQAAQLRYLLEECGHRVAVARNGEEALRLISEELPSLVISDIVMPGMDGYELCRAIKIDEASRNIPVILVTSLSSPHDVFRGLNAGADNFITKPYEERNLLARVDYILSNRELRSRGKLQVGIEIEFAGQRHFITSERQQILDLLISTYEEAIRLNDSLLQRERSLQRSYDTLNGLYALAETLSACRTRREVAEKALARCAMLPGVRTGWLHLVEREGFTTFTAAKLAPELRQGGRLDRDCACKRALGDGTLVDAREIVACEPIQAFGAKSIGFQGHLSVPLISGEESLGILNLVPSSGEGFTQEERRIITAAAAQIASTLDRARLYEDLERKVEERTEALQQSETRFRDFANCAADWFWETDAEQRFTYIAGSDSLEQGTNWDAGVLIGMPRGELMHQLRAEPDPTPTIQRWMDSKERFDRLEFRYQHPERGETWVSLSGTPVLGDAGELIAYRGAAQEITARKRAEIALEKSVERFDLAVRGSSAGIWDWNVETGAVYYAPRFLRLLGYDADQADGSFEFLENSLHGEDRDRVLRALRTHLKERRSFDQECRLRNENGLYRWYRIVGEAIWSAEGQAVRMCGSIVDVTDRHSAEEQLRHANKMEAIGNLTGGIAHDFNNMLTIVLGNLELLETRSAIDGETRELVAAAMSAAERGAALTRQLLAFARRHPLEPKRVHVNELVTSANALVARTLGGNVEVRLHLAKELWPIVIDPGQLDAALVNLAVNARDAMPSGGVLTIETANARLDAAYAATRPDVKPGDYVRLDVSDNGTGIPPEIRDRIFEPFFTTKEIGKGTGLGLAMVFGFIKQSGGHIAVYSEPGVGTTFRLYLPRAGRSVQNVAKGDYRRSNLARAKAGEVVLLVEDDKLVRRVVAAQLRDLGYVVHDAVGSAEALALLETGQRVDLLLTDAVMPGDLQGGELVHRARHRRPGQRALLMSGFADGALRNSKLQLDDLGILNKPFSLRELARRVREMLDSKASPKADVKLGSR